MTVQLNVDIHLDDTAPTVTARRMAGNWAYLSVGDGVALFAPVTVMRATLVAALVAVDTMEPTP